MHLSYHHANPTGGNESYLLRYQSESTSDGGLCVLVDAGEDIQVDRILRPDDELVAICLTHAHLDHYQSLEECRRPETTIYASEPTAAILEDVFDVAARDYDVTTTDATTQAIEAITGWIELAPGIDIHPIPVGHVPGAVGYLFKLTDGEDTRHVLATGDFTERRAAGFPGLDAASYVDIDVLFLTVATDTEFMQNLSEGLAQALQRAHSGAQTLLATSGLLGVQVAYLLDKLTTEFEQAVSIRVVGQVAKLYETLGYDCETVETIPVFEDPTECLAPETITIAGPEVPHERSSGRLFESLQSDPGACVIQLLGSGEDPLTTGQCTIDAYSVVNHPPPDSIKTVHDAIDPHYTIVVHRHRGAGSEFNDLESIVWSPTDANEYTLYEDGTWVSPPWMSHRAVHPEIGSNMGQATDGDLLEALSIPSLSRHDTVDLASEGLNRDRVQQVLAQQKAYHAHSEHTDEPSHPDTVDKTQDPIAPAESDSTPMPAENQETTDDGETTTATAADTAIDSDALFEIGTIGFSSIDPQIIEAIEAGDLDVDAVKQVYRVTEEHAEPPKSEVPASKEDGGGENNTEPADAQRPADEASSEADTSGDSDSNPPDATTDETGIVDTAEKAGDSPDSGTPSADPGDDSQPTSAKAHTDPSSDTDPLSTPGPDSQSVELTLTPLTSALATAAIDDTEFETSEGFILAAVRGYLRGVLAESITEPASGPAELSLEGGGNLDPALETVVGQSDDFEDVSELLRVAIADTLASDLDTTLSVPRLRPYLPLIDAIAENDRYPVTSRAEVVSLAVRHHVAGV